MPLIVENDDLPVQLVRFSPGKALNSFFRQCVGFYELQKLMLGAAYDLCQTFRPKDGLYRKPSEAKHFYPAIVTFTPTAMCTNFLGRNPIIMLTRIEL